MTDDFDPYYTWLGIPPEEQPATHYRLLGIRPFESNLDVICNAGDQRMAFVRTFQVGKRSALSQRLLNEIAAAKVCLLDPDRRKDYDGTLRAAQPMPAPAPQVVSTYSSPASVLVPSRQAPVVRPLPVAARFPAAPANPLPAADPFADAAREVQTLALQPAARASANGKNSLDHAAVSAHAILDQLQQVSPLSAVAYGLLAVGVAMFLGVGLWISFGGNRRQPVVAGDSTVRSAAKEPAAAPATRPQSKPPVASKVAVSSPPSTAGQSTPPAARVAVKPAEPAPLPTAPIHSVPPPATTVPEPAPAGGMSPTLALARLREIGVQNLPPNPDDLRYIGLHNSNYTDADAPCLAAFPKLEVVNFGAVPVTRKTMDHLGSCRALKHLHIPKADLRDEDLACLAKLTDLRSLNAQETQLTAKVLAHIKGPSRLESLYLPQGVGREIIPYLANLPNLRNFQPMPREITDDDMKVLGQLQHLNMLDLQGAVLSAEGYKHLTNLHELNYAHLSSRAPPGVMVHLKDAQLVFLNFPDSSTEG